jgi:tryprostatin B 6-hydroxylase
MNVSKWFHYYSFDIVGDLAFGKSFDMLKNGRIHFAIELLQRGMAPTGLLTPISWMIPVMAAAPIIGSEYRRLCDWCAEQVEQRRKMKVDVPDITSWLLKDPRGDRLWLNGDARLIVVAGSDATAAAMTHVFYHLAVAPSHAERLRAELKTLINPSAPFSVGDVRHADHLNGVINEALRLHPPVPSGTYRITPPQGITVDGVYLPGEVNITLPHYVIGRSEDHWVRPNEFIPERWYSRPELIKNKNAFVPFSIGPYGCIGKQLALMELRAVTCLLVRRFDVRFAPDEDGSSLINKSVDAFTLRMGDLNLIFEERPHT